MTVPLEFFTRSIPMMVLLWIATTATGQPVYEEAGGMIAFEVEDIHETDQWSLATEASGFSGEGYFRWDGPNSFGIGGLGILQYEVDVETGGDYTVVLHNYHDNPDSSEGNDIWLRVNGGPWIKLYNHVVSRWNWVTLPENGHHFPGWNTFLPGRNVIEFSGRSHRFCIDRAHFYLSSEWEHAKAQSLEVPLSPKTWTIPELRARFVGTPDRGYAPLTVAFDTAMVEIPEGLALATTTWKLGDGGAQSTNHSACFTYDMPGTYSVKLDVVDSEGNRSEYTSQVDVLPGYAGSLHIHALAESSHYGGDRPERLVDERENTRWSNNEPNGWVQFDLKGTYPVNGLLLSFFKGDERVYTFDVKVSRDGNTFENVLQDARSTGLSTDYQVFPFEERTARYVRLINKGNSEDGFMQITRARVTGQHVRQQWWGTARKEGDWLLIEPFGYFSMVDYPWSYHQEHGWLWCADGSLKSTFSYNLLPGGWVYLDLDMYPVLYDYSDPGWKWIEVTKEGDRWVYSYANSTWSLLDAS